MAERVSGRKYWQEFAVPPNVRIDGGFQRVVSLVAPWRTSHEGTGVTKQVEVRTANVVVGNVVKTGPSGILEVDHRHPRVGRNT
eukprot:CAMPEP_0198590568 /NCGR_PEP_ID=MMETSP1462-20131121/135824_1 /TAXON_ID=1333877 /ORGANISM="Brandtodinium nutriculum, Strain RCC3387" /LENGTH=83 /DNA_ID=CAMNT_0044322101 /DNA_START=187 /DNA_END=435 /DNA_ORIENTATION=-